MSEPSGRFVSERSGPVDLELEGQGSGVPAGRDNLAVRAAEAFLARAGVRVNLRIRLCKRIPAAAGLGGGSSDAAAVLRALDRLFPGALGGSETRAVALGLGADVPYFLAPRPAFVSGIGEIVEAAPGVPALPLLLAHPGRALATARVYALYDQQGGALTPTGAGPTMRTLPALQGASASECERLQAFLRALRESGSESPLLGNDLEPAAVRLCPAVATLRKAIEGVGAAGTGLSGSGPTVFGVFGSLDAAREAQQHLALAAPARSWVVTSAASI